MFLVQPATKSSTLREIRTLKEISLGASLDVASVFKRLIYLSDWMRHTFQRLFPHLVPLAINQKNRTLIGIVKLTGKFYLLNITNN